MGSDHVKKTSEICVLSVSKWLMIIISGKLAVGWTNM